MPISMVTINYGDCRSKLGGDNMGDVGVPALVLRHISKSFGGQHALEDVSLTIKPGEIHGLLGQNGSGKSTLIKILAGYHTPDDGGELEFNGRMVKLPLHPGEFRKLGMSFVHQDLGLIPSLSVVENLIIGKLAAITNWYISWDKERWKAKKTFAEFGLNIDPLAKVSDLSQVECALLAIVRAVEDIRSNYIAQNSGRGLLVLDEPTVFLPKAGIDQLFRLVRDISATGVSVLFVSHDLNEVLEITDRVSVLRDGRMFETLVTSEITKDQLVETIIGRQLEALQLTDKNTNPKSVDIVIKNLSGGTVKNVSINLVKGEVLGLTGLIGSGFEEIPYLIFGATPVTSGQLKLGAKTYDLVSMTPKDAINAQIALLPADRLGDGSIGSLPVIDNLMMQVIDCFNRLKLNRQDMLHKSNSLLMQYNIRPKQPRMFFQDLSGGNQQKVLLAKWFQTRPRLVLLHEPTQGVDIEARQQVFEIIRSASNEGSSLICSSSDHEQLAIICDRVLIFDHGSVVSELTGGNITKDRITKQCYNSLDIHYLNENLEA